MNDLPYKGFIFPNGEVIRPDSTNSHETMAFHYIRKTGNYERYRNSNHSSAQDFLIYELNAMQVRTAGEQVLLLLVNNYRIYANYINEYKSNDKRWNVFLLSKP